MNYSHLFCTFVLTVSACTLTGAQELPQRFWGVGGVCKASTDCKGAFKSETSTCGNGDFCCVEKQRISCYKCRYFPAGVSCCPDANLAALPNNATITTTTTTKMTDSASSSSRPTSLGPLPTTSRSDLPPPLTTTHSLSVVATAPAEMTVGSPNGVNVIAIVGACVGAVVGVAVILCLILGVIFMRKRRRQQQLQAVANDYISGRPIAHPSSSVGRSSVTPSTSPNSPQQTYANLALTHDDGASVNYAQLSSTGNDATMSDALSERNGPNHSQRNGAPSSRAHAEPESAPTTPYSQLDPNGERFAKFHSIDH